MDFDCHFQAIVSLGNSKDALVLMASMPFLMGTPMKKTEMEACRAQFIPSPEKGSFQRKLDNA